MITLIINMLLKLIFRTSFSMIDKTSIVPHHHLERCTFGKPGTRRRYTYITQYSIRLIGFYDMKTMTCSIGAGTLDTRRLSEHSALFGPLHLHDTQIGIFDPA